MKKTLYIFLIFSSFFFSIEKISGQTSEHLVPLTTNPVQMKDAARFAGLRYSTVHTDTFALPTDTVVLPSQGLRDNFSYDSHRPDTTMWDLAFTNPPTGVFVNRTWPIAPINVGVCTFDGIKWNGEPYDALANVNSTGPCDELVSRPIDLTGHTVADSVYLSFWYQAKGRGYAPNAQDSFLLDFNIPAWNPDQFTTIWKNIWYKEGYTPTSSDTNFHIVMIKLDSASYFTKGFRFRFHNYASQCGSNDHWHLDNVYLKTARTYSDTIVKEASFVYEMPSFLKDFRAMPASHYKPAINMIDTVGIAIRNNDTLSTGRLITYGYDVLDESGSSIYSYPVSTFPILTYDSIGYQNYQPQSSPAVYPSHFPGFPQFPIGDTGFYVIRHKLLDAPRLDSVDYRQSFYNYYAYDDGSAEVGYGLYGQYSQLAYKFTMPIAITDTLKAIQMYFLPVQDITNLEQRTFTLTVWNDQGNQPGAVLYSERTQSPEYSFETPDRFVTYKIDSGIVVLNPGQTYYIGWVQQAIDRLYIGFDFNDDHHDKIYYNTSGNWYTSIFNGSLMMRPVFGQLYPTGEDQTGIHEQQSASAFSIYPNPANDKIMISGLKDVNGNIKASVMDISGREVITSKEIYSDRTIDVASLSAGVYFLQLRNASGELIGTQKFVISR